jgi:hypothetical protein
MQIVKTNGNRVALSLEAYLTPEIMDEIRTGGSNLVDILIWWDETDQEYIVSPQWNRVKEITGEFNDLKKR